ncbi:Probable E3 ubiquitin-protein ligase [Seminavis robusta]|uniref:RING-type E3 ubiquitin transferase n=1 Tax=Seminavis robusta TaxID=568900 RepID=A0A9N8D7Q7_9STRA|nr:Probable E3 ubiquitin-protein ligase [Seminavis robusta]|eukprot:Sro31_g020470.1 Probable E3 ubiquitin-protein ligase (342) ;mRNA; f:137347-138372
MSKTAWLVCVVALLRAVGAQTIARVCPIPENSPRIAVGRYGDERDDGNVIVDASEIIQINFTTTQTISSSSGGVRRQLPSSKNPMPAIFIPGQKQRRVSDEEESYPNTTADGGGSSSSSSIQGSSNTVLIHQCPCALGHFCPVELDTCGVAASNHELIGCFANSNETTFLRNGWPFFLVFQCTIVFAFLFTEKGTRARHYILLISCQPNINERLVDRFLEIIRANPDTDNIQQQQGVEPQQVPTELVLRTTTFESKSDLDEDACCTICLAALAEGDRVGNLSCNHKFHVDCLRQWLLLRNVCPLCQTANAATPRYAQTEEGNETASTTNSDSSHAENRHNQ